MKLYWGDETETRYMGNIIFNKSEVKLCESERNVLCVCVCVLL